MHNAALDEIENEAVSITNELSELYMMLETGKITESEFDAREKELLDRLDEIQEEGNGIQNADDDKEER
jgi:hypothetical protein